MRKNTNPTNDKNKSLEKRKKEFVNHRLNKISEILTWVLCGVSFLICFTIHLFFMPIGQRGAFVAVFIGISVALISLKFLILHILDKVLLKKEKGDDKTQE